MVKHFSALNCICHFEELAKNMSNGKQIYAILLDISKAIDVTFFENMNDVSFPPVLGDSPLVK
jgi:hypothetical protein